MKLIVSFESVYIIGINDRKLRHQFSSPPKKYPGVTCQTSSQIIMSHVRIVMPLHNTANCYCSIHPISESMSCLKWITSKVHILKCIVWHGVVFVRFGLFKDAKFKFKILFDDFPKKAPKVYFISEVYHPNVDAENGLLDLGEDIEKNWNYGADHLIFTVVERIRLIFLDCKFL